MLNILITGASGTVGKKLISLLVSKGHTVRTLTTQTTHVNPSKNIFHWDPEKGEIDTAALSGINIIVHLAGANVGKHRWSKKYKAEILNSRVKGTELLFKTCTKINCFPLKYISMSGTGFYDVPSNEKLSENSKNGHHFLAHVCDQWEKSTLPFEKAGTEITILRTGPVLSKAEGLLKAFKMTLGFGIIPIIGSRNHIFSWVHIEDLCSIILHSIESQMTGTFNTVSPVPCSQIAFAKAIAKSAGKKCIYPTVPAFIIRTILGEMADIALTDQNVSSEKLVKSGFQFQYPEIETALNSLMGAK